MTDAKPGTTKAGAELLAAVEAWEKARERWLADRDRTPAPAASDAPREP
jgi:hypothetical protein